MPLKIDLSEVKTGAVPTGWYMCEVVASTLAGVDGNFPRWSLFLKVVEGDYKGATASKTFWLNQTGARELKTFLEPFYDEADLDAPDFEIDENRFVGMEFDAYFKPHKPRPNETNPPLNDVGTIKKASANQAPITIPDDFFVS